MRISSLARPGGLLTREKFVPASKPKPGWVAHLGYVSLFPLMLRLLPPDAPQLPPLLELLADPARLRVTEVALAMGNAPRLLRRWLPCSLLTRASSAWPLAASFSK